MRNFRKREDGAVMVLVALAMSAFLAMVALVLDGGHFYLEKNRLQNMVDAAALAGAQELPSSPEQATDSAKWTAFQNGDADQIFVEFLSENKGIKVHGQKSVSLTFGKVFGFDDPVLEASAVVQLAPLDSVKGAIPLGVQYNTDMSKADLIELKVGDPVVGNFGAIELTGSGARNYLEDFKKGFDKTLHVGEILSTEPGKMSGATEDAVDYRVSKCPDATHLNYSSGCERVVIVMVYKPVNVDVNKIKEIEIVGFATFFLEGTAPYDKSIVLGRFIETSLNGGSSPDQYDYGAYGLKLIQ
ncbi:pilus assembly protein [Virgibacillus sp. MSP4-1]|uniref:TadE/TadG family type IV pilus assembly protein n=1 Tax=Virgibacillus sp. MSP4-1 TaxID=2700081 RepID=UPI0003A9EDC5|nr:TadE/TadG family type IV pilus assembly protein [Virgibacillus sp. MSP4-1]QHS22503.1 pilus assembly protein [Virgibacillus sp. MSP4-1]